MKESIAAYEKLLSQHHGEDGAAIRSTPTTPPQKTACKAGSGPDIWYNWGGTWSLEQAWGGCTVPNEDVLAPRI